MARGKGLFSCWPVLYRLKPYGSIPAGTTLAWDISAVHLLKGGVASLFICIDFGKIEYFLK